jgi:hypothetical protein
MTKETDIKTMEDKFDLIDDFLTRCEDWMHGDDGDDCTKARRALIDIKQYFDLSVDIKAEANELLFCGGCGEERDFIVETDSNSGRACKNPMCKEK